jgi:hypothetical protein
LNYARPRAEIEAHLRRMVVRPTRPTAPIGRRQRDHQ